MLRAASKLCIASWKNRMWRSPLRWRSNDHFLHYFLSSFLLQHLLNPRMCRWTHLCPLINICTEYVMLTHLLMFELTVYHLLWHSKGTYTVQTPQATAIEMSRTPYWFSEHPKTSLGQAPALAPPRRAVNQIRVMSHPCILFHGGSGWSRTISVPHPFPLTVLFLTLIPQWWMMWQCQSLVRMIITIWT